MIPRSSVEFSLELIGIALSRGDRALVYSGHTVLPRRCGLKETMPVQCCSFGRARGVVEDVVVDGDLNNISPIGLNCRPREGSIDEQNRFLVAIRRNHASTDSEIV